MNTDAKKFVGCQHIPRISFNPWTGYTICKSLCIDMYSFKDCEEEEEIPISFSRERRDTSSKSETKFKRRRKDNAEPLKNASLLKTITNLEERIEELEGTCSRTEKKEDYDEKAVCIDFNGKVRIDDEVWNIPFNSGENKCVQCTCKVIIIIREVYNIVDFSL